MEMAEIEDMTEVGDMTEVLDPDVRKEKRATAGYQMTGVGVNRPAFKLNCRAVATSSFVTHEQTSWGRESTLFNGQIKGGMICH
jgi:hypothetical protein